MVAVVPIVRIVDEAGVWEVSGKDREAKESVDSAVWEDLAAMF